MEPTPERPHSRPRKCATLRLRRWRLRSGRTPTASFLASRSNVVGTTLGVALRRIPVTGRRDHAHRDSKARCTEFHVAPRVVEDVTDTTSISKRRSSRRGRQEGITRSARQASRRKASSPRATSRSSTVSAASTRTTAQPRCPRMGRLRWSSPSPRVSRLQPAERHSSDLPARTDRDLDVLLAICKVNFTRDQRARRSADGLRTSSARF